MVYLNAGALVVEMIHQLLAKYMVVVYLEVDALVVEIICQ